MRARLRAPIYKDLLGGTRAPCFQKRMRGSIKKEDIKRLNQERPALITRFLIIKTRPTQTHKNRVAFAFSRRAGSAVTRNRFKRRIRALVAGSEVCGGGIDVFVIAKQPLSGLSESLWQKEKKRIKVWFEGH